MCKIPLSYRPSSANCLRRLPGAWPLNVLAFRQPAAFPCLTGLTRTSVSHPSVRLGLWTWSSQTNTQMRIHGVCGSPLLYKHEHWLVSRSKFKSPLSILREYSGSIGFLSGRSSQSVECIKAWKQPWPVWLGWASSAKGKWAGKLGTVCWAGLWPC